MQPPTTTARVNRFDVLDGLPEASSQSRPRQTNEEAEELALAKALSLTQSEAGGGSCVDEELQAALAASLAPDVDDEMQRALAESMNESHQTYALPPLPAGEPVSGHADSPADVQAKQEEMLRRVVLSQAPVSSAPPSAPPSAPHRSNKSRLVSYFAHAETEKAHTSGGASGSGATIGEPAGSFLGHWPGSGSTLGASGLPPGHSGQQVVRAHHEPEASRHHWASLPSSKGQEFHEHQAHGGDRPPHIGHVQQAGGEFVYDEGYSDPADDRSINARALGVRGASGDPSPWIPPAGHYEARPPGGNAGGSSSSMGLPHTAAAQPPAGDSWLCLCDGGVEMEIIWGMQARIQRPWWGVAHCVGWGSVGGVACG